MSGRVLEIGCADCDWLKWAKLADPTLELRGVDWRPCERAGAFVVQGDVRNQMYSSASFDAVVSLSAIEHIGLGHYEDDPIDPDGDIVTIQHAYRWLKPGGWLYVDVPYRPDVPFQVVGTAYRCYDDDALGRRLLRPFWGEGGRIAWMGYAHASRPSRLLPKPTEAPLCGKPYYYAACWCQKTV